jgi:Holliday junction resolvase RusA-like endonuclease
VNTLFLRHLNEWPEQMRKWRKGKVTHRLEDAAAAIIRTEFLEAMIKPQAKQTTRFTKFGHAFTPAKKRQYVADLVEMFKAHEIKQFEGRLRVTVVYSFVWRKSDAKIAKKQSWAYMDKRPDIDNLFKPVADALQGSNVIKDDGQIVEVRVRKIRSPQDGIAIKIEQISEHV